jgi:DNA-binding response OmpR family regulator
VAPRAKTRPQSSPLNSTSVDIHVACLEFSLKSYNSQVKWPKNGGMAAAKKVKFRSTERIRVLIADDDWQSSRRALDFLTQHGFDVRMCHTGFEAKKLLVTWKPKVLIVDLLLPEANAFELLRFCQHEPGIRGHNVAVIVMSGHNNEENVRESYHRGARDYIARPVLYPDLLNRVVLHCRGPRTIEQEAQASNAANTNTLKIADLIVTQTLQKLSFEEMLYNITCMTNLKIKGLRCSVVFGLAHDKGIVLASNDRKDIAGLNLDLRKYPEIQLVINTGKMVVIDNLDESKALSRIRSELKEIHFNSVIVCPLYYHHKIFGVISLRMPEDKNYVPDNDVNFMDFVSKVTSLYLSTQDPQKISKYGLLSLPKAN